MERIYTHYDNLKVARNAPPEIIRAAYKSLAHKYHPDRNQNDPGALRIMTLINIAYEELSDPLKRKLHDVWIKEQEKSQQHNNSPKNSAVNNKTEGPIIYRSIRNSRNALLFIVVFIVLANIFFIDFHHADEKSLSNSPANIPSIQSAPKSPISYTRDVPLPHKKPIAPLLVEEEYQLVKAFGQILKFPADTTFVEMTAFIKENEAQLNPNYINKESKPKLPYVKPARAPNGELWPSNAGYVKGYKKLNTDGYSSVTVDNTQNDSDVFVRLVSISGNITLRVRQFFIPASSRFTVNKVRFGNYDIRYHNLDSGAFAKSESFTLHQETTSNGIQYSNITMTLYKVRDGNMQTYAISEADF